MVRLVSDAVAIFPLKFKNILCYGSANIQLKMMMF